ncbi:hypothetical protein KUTeg_014349 [Tegillarca granosa]|uniref:UBR-type domain-containing protein n=1 Tax=Tegillarca granosa TaxID=220873 RepID=A0ABQ9F026_TEGGR|nr:hypothetical protein KUTeg_014349 [Tegillarca granosa]
MASENELAPESSETQDNENVISMVDVLREEEELEADANAVLGDSDAANCTYPLGYVNRQALYACYTCSPSEPAGVCLACSYECHDGHDLYELYTKRNFCCDCGNSKFPDLKCKLYENKDSTNAKNVYNHNFKGTYCICERPYPDPEDEIEDEMIQCVMCEDWYHGRSSSSESGTKSSGDSESNGIDKKNEIKIKPDGDNTANNEQEQCLLKELRTRETIYTEGATFWENGWRKKLCTCSKCLDMYKEREIEYIIDEEDTVHAYESRGKANSSASSGYDKGIQALNKMDRVQQVEVLHGFNDLKSELSEYLKKEEDIREFFSTMEARKRQRTAAPMQYFSSALLS